MTTLDRFEEKFAAFYIALLVFAVFLNGVCLIGLTRKHHKRRFRDHLFISMSICDLLRICLTAPMEIRGLLQHSLVGEESACRPIAFFMYMFEFTSISHLFLIVGDRYICTCKPTLALELYLNHSTIYKAMAYSYSIGVFWAVLPLIGIGQYGFQIHNIQCGLKPLHDAKSKVYITFLLIFLYLIPFSVALFCYYKVWKKTKSQAADIVTVDNNNEDGKELYEYFVKDHKQLKLILALLLTFVFTWFLYDVTMFEEIYVDGEANAYLEIVSTFIGQSSAVIVPLVMLCLYTDLRKSLARMVIDGKKNSARETRFSTRNSRVVPALSSVGNGKNMTAM